MTPEVYILQCANARYYIGSTNNLERRMQEHIQGKVKATKNLRPIKLVFHQQFENLTKTRQTEYRLKSYKNKNIIENIIKDGIIKIR